MAWLEQRIGGTGGPVIALPGDALAFLRQLYHLLRAIDGDFRAMLPGVSFVGKSGDPVLAQKIRLNPCTLSGKKLPEATLEEMESLWQESKQQEPTR